MNTLESQDRTDRSKERKIKNTNKYASPKLKFISKNDFNSSLPKSKPPPPPQQQTQSKHKK